VNAPHIRSLDRTAQPLAGVRVIDFTQVMLGPCATQVLGDYGADVIKIERMGAGDLSRSSIPNDPGGQQNPVFCSLNRNKRSLALNLRTEEGRAVARRLIETADVVVNNFRAGVMELMGLGYDELTRINPRIIFASGTGFGTEGPYAHKGGQDVLAQALSGTMARRADASLPLSIYPTALADYSAGMHLVQGILLALLQRERTGIGQMVSVSLYDSMLAMQMQEAAMWLMRQRELNWAAMPLSGVFETKDGALVLVGAFKAHPLRDICAALGIDDLSSDPRFEHFELMVANKKALQDLLRARFRTGTTAHWIEALEGQDLLCAPVKSLADALADPQTAVNGMLVEVEAGNEVQRFVGSPIHLSSRAFAVRRAPPRLGQNGEEILGEHGYSHDAIAALKAEGVVA